MSDELKRSDLSRRELVETEGKTAAAPAILTPLLQSAIVSCAMAADDGSLNAVAGGDRVCVLPGKTYLRGWTGYGEPPKPVRLRFGETPPEPPPPLKTDRKSTRLNSS